jgi:hypothetical protein
MRPSNRTQFLLATILSLALTITAQQQSAPPSGPPAPPSPTRSPCYTLRFAEVPDMHQRWARIATGDEWISGCLGPEGTCFCPIWIPC